MFPAKVIRQRIPLLAALTQVKAPQEAVVVTALMTVVAT